MKRRVFLNLFTGHDTIVLLEKYFIMLNMKWICFSLIDDASLTTKLLIFVKKIATWYREFNRQSTENESIEQESRSVFNIFLSS